MHVDLKSTPLQLMLGKPFPVLHATVGNVRGKSVNRERSIGETASE